MSHVHRGKIKSGTIILSEPVTLPDGTDVVINIEPVEAAEASLTTGNASSSLPFIGIWADRDDISDSGEWVRKERETWQQRLARED